MTGNLDIMCRSLVRPKSLRVTRSSKLSSAFAVILGSAILYSGCISGETKLAACRETAEEDRSSTLANLRNSRGELSVDQIKNLISSVEPWPTPSDRAYDEHQMKHLMCVGLRLQSVRPDLVASAMELFVARSDTSSGKDADWGREWSRALLLLRVMFEVPSNEVQVDRQGWRRGPLSFAAYSCVSEDFGRVVPQIESLPLKWDSDGPVMIARRLGYFGGRYRVGDEFWYFHDHYGYRHNLDCDAIMEN